MNEKEKTAALLMCLCASVCFHGRRDGPVRIDISAADLVSRGTVTYENAWWYKWCTDRWSAENSPPRNRKEHPAARRKRRLRAAVWWALRMPIKESAEEWLEYIEFKLRTT